MFCLKLSSVSCDRLGVVMGSTHCHQCVMIVTGCCHGIDPLSSVCDDCDWVISRDHSNSHQCVMTDWVLLWDRPTVISVT